MQHQDTIIGRILRIFANLFDQLLMIFDLQTLDDSVETRLKRLRFIYYNDHAVHIGYRRVRDVLRGHVAPRYHDYYERMLTAERTANNIIKNLHSGARGSELLEQMQRLSEKTAQLIEQLQNTDEVQALYDPESAEAQMVQDARDWLTMRVEEALELQAGIPARIMSFKTTATGRSIDKLSQRIARLTQRLDDIADSYADIDAYTSQTMHSEYDDPLEL